MKEVSSTPYLIRHGGGGCDDACERWVDGWVRGTQSPPYSLSLTVRDWLGGREKKREQSGQDEKTALGKRSEGEAGPGKERSLRGGKGERERKGSTKSLGALVAVDTQNPTPEAEKAAETGGGPYRTEAAAAAQHDSYPPSPVLHHHTLLWRKKGGPSLSGKQSVFNGPLHNLAGRLFTVPPALLPFAITNGRASVNSDDEKRVLAVESVTRHTHS